jgi:poly(3-hydroxybutyrate) depolymerase
MKGTRNLPLPALALPIVASVLIGLTMSANAKVDISQLNIDLSQSSVSGLSSGGYMATQFQLAHSEIIVGAGIVGAGPYYCALNDIGTALGQCVSKASSTINNTPFLAKYKSFQSAGLLAPVAALQDDKVLIIHGTLDKTVNRRAADLLAEQYMTWLDASQVRYVDDKAFSHHFPTLNEGSACDISESPFIGNCEYDAAGEILEHIYGSLTPPAESDIAMLDSLDLSELTSLSSTSIADEAFIFVPQSCKDGESCKLHISFHGCNQSSQDVNDAYAQKSGFNRWAQNNNIVILYPQVEKSMFMPLNPQGCWDWWGYTDENYANKKGPQIHALYDVMQALSGIKNSK